MNIEQYRYDRETILIKIDKLQKEHCDNCQIHYELNKKKNVTALSNACKECEIGKKIQSYGDELLKLTREKKERF
jgi:hydrogenase maturation factor HypF (carbamoyltransferase family)